jgi:biopolymer transport protein ExbD
VAISTSSDAAVNADINVTPMADVMLVLLIIFMITTPLIASGFEAQIPQGINLIKAPEESDDITLGLDRNGDFYINTAPVPRAQLEARLAELYRNRTRDKILYLRAHQDLTMDKIQDAISIARAAGVRVIAAVTDQRPGTESTVSTERSGGR